MLKNISCSEALFLSLPVVGPACCLWGMVKVENERAKAVNVLVRIEKRLDEGKGDLKPLQEKFNEQKEKYKKILQKGESYSKCGILSSFLTIAALVALVVLSFFSIGGAIPLFVGLVIHAGIYRQSLLKYREDLIELKENGQGIEPSPASVSGVPSAVAKSVIGFVSATIPGVGGNSLEPATDLLSKATRH